MISNQHIACPACDYKHGKRGKPVARQGEMICLSCGNRWKEVTPAFKQPVEAARIKLSADKGHFKNAGSTGAGVSLSSNRIASKSIRLSWVAVTSAVGALALAIAVTFMFLTSGLNSRAEQGVHVTELQFEELVRHNRGKVVRVKGAIYNSGSQTEPVRRLALILRKSNGEELTRWYYNSPVSKLSPGKKTRFVSSIQYDTPVIASVDVRFE